MSAKEDKWMGNNIVTLLQNKIHTIKTVSAEFAACCRSDE